MSTACLKDFAGYLEESERSPLTIKNYLCDLNAFAAWFTEINEDELEPGKITPTDLRQFKEFLVLEGLRPSSVNRKLASLRSFIHWAQEAGLLSDGRTPAVPKTIRTEKLGPRWLDRREQNALLRAVERGGSGRDVAIVKLLLNTGLRVRELCDLAWRDIKIGDRKGTMAVRRGKGDKHRDVPLNKDARMAFSSLGYSSHIGFDERVFKGQRGPLTPMGVQILLRKYAQAAKLEDVSPHSLRHTFCKNLIDAAVGIEKVAALAGHENLETTRRYCAPSLRDLQEAVERIGDHD